MAAPNLLWFSYPTYGASGAETPAATYGFYSRDYQPPRRTRAVTSDTVINHNGVFKYVFDNGPSGLKWKPFTLVLDDRFDPWVGGMATQQLANLDELWNHKGLKGFSGPEGSYEITWGDQDFDPKFMDFPDQVGDKIELVVVVAIEEA